MDNKKDHINIIFLGHVNSGKSTTIGRLLWDYNVFDKRYLNRIEKYAEEYKKKSSKYAFIMDTLRIERERSMSVDITHRNFKTPKYEVTVIDSPGHKDYIKNMIRGTSLADAAILVIDSTHENFEKGISEEGQTYEHSIIANTLGIKQVIIAVNKMDDGSVNYSQERFDEIKDEMTKVLSKIGFKQNQFKFVPISGLEGDNLIEKSSNFSWWTGFTLLEAIDSLEKQDRSELSWKPLRIPVYDVNYVGGVGTVAVGRVEYGEVKPGSQIFYPLYNGNTDVKSIEINYENSSIAYSGDNVGLNLFIPRSYIKRGDVIGDYRRELPKICVKFIAQIIIVNHPGKIHAGYQSVFFCHTAHAPCRFAKLLKRVDFSHGKKITENPEWIKKGDYAVVEVEPLKPFIVEEFRYYPSLGRIICRDMKQTIAIGIVMDVEK